MSSFCGTGFISDHISFENFINSIQSCPKHNRRAQFICLQKRCENNMILCIQCITQHNGHQFQTIQKYFKGQPFQNLSKGQSKKHQHFQDLQRLVTKKLDQIQQSVKQSVKKVKKGLEDALNRLNQISMKISIRDKTIDNQMMVQIKRYLQKTWTYTRCQKMKQCFDKILNAVQDSYKNISEDLFIFFQEQDWQLIDVPDYHDIQDRYFKHLHNHQQKIVDYYRFDIDSKAPNIKLVTGRLQAHYLRQTPSLPFILCDNLIIPQKNKWIIEVSQCDSKMLFFNSSIIYVGVCKPEIAKKFNFHQLNQGGKGAYLIGSNGWSYHHTNPSIDRQDIVGFNFGKGDKLELQLDFKANRGSGKLKFKKLGKIYDNKFEMNLDLEQNQLKRLKPCVGFHQSIGVQVKIINFN